MKRIEYYLTIFYGVYNKRNRTFTFANGGQNCMPLVIRENNVEEVFIPGLPICTMFEGVNHEVKSIALGEKDRILFYTDGVSEAKNKDNVEFEDELKSICEVNKKMGSKELVEEIYDNLIKFSNGDINDDVAILLIKGL